jgi:hypothetical protein
VNERIARHRLSIFSENFSQQFLPTSRKISCLQSRDRVVNEPRAVFSFDDVNNCAVTST